LTKLYTRLSSLLAGALLATGLAGCEALQSDDIPPPPRVSNATLLPDAEKVARDEAALPPFTQPVARPEQLGPAGSLPQFEIISTAQPTSQRTTAAPERRTGGDIVLNFVADSVHDVAKIVLGEILGLNYSVDTRVSTSITLETVQPVTRDQVLPLFERSLAAAGIGLVLENGVYHLVPLAEASREAGPVGPETPGYGTETIPLRYVRAEELQPVLTAVAPQGASVQASPSGNAMFVTGSSGERRSLAQLIRQFDTNRFRGMSFAIYRPQTADAERLAEELSQILNAPGLPTAGRVQLIAIERLNAILGVAPQTAYLQEVSDWVRFLDVDGGRGGRELYVYRVQHGVASELAKVLNDAFSSEISASAEEDGFGIDRPDGGRAQAVTIREDDSPIRISSDDSNNALIIRASAREYDAILEALEKLDTRPLQVLIEAVITEVSLNDRLRYGVQWYFKWGNSSFTLSESDSGAISSVFPGFTYLFTNGSTITAALDALATITNVNVVSSPQLLVLNNRTARLQVGDQVPIATQSAVSVDNPEAPIVNSIEFRDTGVILEVTPRVNASGLVTLEIDQQVSDVIPTTTSDIDSPTIQQRQISSTVAVQDGETIALGGLIRDNLSDANSGVPILKDIPVLGVLFGTTNTDRRRTELLILLTPRLVRDIDDARSATNELLEKIRTVEPQRLPPES